MNGLKLKAMLLQLALLGMLPRAPWQLVLLNCHKLENLTANMILFAVVESSNLLQMFIFLLVAKFEVNESLNSQPELVNNSTYENGLDC